MLRLENRQRGFTLVELLVVIAIIGILITVTLVTLDPFTQISKARDSQRKSDLKQIQTALELYYQDNDSYPTAANWGALLTTLKAGKYITQDIQDKNGKTYFYYRDSGGTGYRMFASLDNKKDLQACTQDGTACSSATGVSANCGGVCTYEVKSSNL